MFRSPFAPAVIIPFPSSGLYNYLAERASSYPAFKGTWQPARTYPQGALGAEFLGLLGEVSQSELATPRYAHAKPGQIVGQSGVEATYDSLLSPGFVRARLRVDSRGRIAGPLEVAHGKQLPTLKLTIDARIQRAADKAIRDGMALAQANGHGDATSAAAVVMNPRTGGIYALASYPMYNQVAAANNAAYRNSLYRSTSANPPLLDLATQGLYPTGSTFKPIVAEAALTQGLITPNTSLLCSGAFQLGNFTFHNVEAGVYSYMTLHTALAESCDTWFYRLGNLVYLHQPGGADLAIQRWAHTLGLGRTTGVDLPGEQAGVVPTPAWLQRTQHLPWYEGQTINLAIGQGFLAVTPLQLAVAYSALANGGTVVTAPRRRLRAERHGRPDAEVPTGAPREADGSRRDPAGPLRGGALPHRHVVVGLRELPRAGGRQDGHRAGAVRQRPLVVRVLGAGDEPEGRRRRADRPRRLRLGGGSAGREGDLPGLLPRQVNQGNPWFP